MPKYIIAYRGGQKPSTPEEGAAQQKRWGGWVENLGEAMVNPGTPVGTSKTVTPDGVSDTDWASRLTGYSIVEAGDMDAALKMAESCPFLEIGTLEVGELMDMKRP